MTFQDHSPKKRHSLAHSWDVQSHRGTDRQGPAGGSGAELRAGGALKLQNLGSFFFLPHPPPPDTPHLDSYGRKKKKKTSFSYLIFGKPPGDHNLALRTPPSLSLLGTDTHTHTHTHTLTLTQTHSPTALHHGGSSCSGSK